PQDDVVAAHVEYFAAQFQAELVPAEALAAEGADGGRQGFPGAVDHLGAVARLVEDVLPGLAGDALEGGGQAADAVGLLVQGGERGGNERFSGRDGWARCYIVRPVF